MFLGNFDADPANDFTTITGINLPVKKKNGFEGHDLAELETDELNDQYSQSWSVSSVAAHKGVPESQVSIFFEDYRFSTAEVFLVMKSCSHHT